MKKKKLRIQVRWRWRLIEAGGGAVEVAIDNNCCINCSKTNIEYILNTTIEHTL